MIIKRPAGGWNAQGIATHPGEVFEEEFLKPMGISRHKLALDTNMPATRVGEIVRGRRAISPDTVLRLARYFGTSPEFWLNLQQQHDLSVVRAERRGQIEREVRALSLTAFLQQLRRRAPEHAGRLPLHPMAPRGWRIYPLQWRGLPVPPGRSAAFLPTLMR